MDSVLNISLGGASRSGKGANDSLEVSSRKCSFFLSSHGDGLLKDTNADLI